MATGQPTALQRIGQRMGAGIDSASGVLRGVAGGAEDTVLGLAGDSRRARYLRYLLRRAGEDQIAQVAGSLTFTTLLSLVPFVTIALGLFAAFPIFDQLGQALEEFLVDNLLPEAVSDAVMTHVAAFSEKAARLTAAGVFALGVTAVLLLQTIDRALNAIWRVPRPRPLAERVLVYWAVVSLGPLLIGGGLAITSYAVSASLGLLPGGQWVTHWLADLVPVALTLLAFTLLYAAVPNRDVQWKHAAIGGAAATLGFELMKHLLGWYIARFASYQLIYGAFAAIPIFLLWVYLSWIMVLVGALIAATWPLMAYERAETRRWPGMAFVDAMRILALLNENRERGGATPRQIRAALRTGFAESETLLESLRDAGWIGRFEAARGEARWGARAERRWMLLADPRTLPVAAVFRRFAFDIDSARRRADADDALGDFGLARLATLLDDSLDLTLAEALAPPPPAAAGARKRIA
ncbi:MAG: YihY family inner membrane protein [Burkholderiales bacterium]|nr:YihY family inner membrane protein [Burkholderiales bacterium]